MINAIKPPYQPRLSTSKRKYTCPNQVFSLIDIYLLIINKNLLIIDLRKLINQEYMTVEIEEKLTGPRVTAIISMFISASILLLAVFNLAVFIYQDQVSSIPVSYSIENMEQQDPIAVNGSVFEPNKRTAHISIPTTKGMGVYLLFLLELIKVLSFAIVFLLLGKIFHLVAKDQPFSKQNYKYLFVIGWILFIASIYSHFRGWYIIQLVGEDIASKSIILEYSTGAIGDLYILGIFVYSFGYILKQGNRIYKEQQLTI